jgi:hypothetical protein
MNLLAAALVVVEVSLAKTKTLSHLHPCIQ